MLKGGTRGREDGGMRERKDTLDWVKDVLLLSRCPRVTAVMYGCRGFCRAMLQHLQRAIFYLQSSKFCGPPRGDLLSDAAKGEEKRLKWDVSVCTCYKISAASLANLLETYHLYFNWRLILWGPRMGPVYNSKISADSVFQPASMPLITLWDQTLQDIIRVSGHYQHKINT